MMKDDRQNGFFKLGYHGAYLDGGPRQGLDRAIETAVEHLRASSQANDVIEIHRTSDTGQRLYRCLEVIRQRNQDDDVVILIDPNSLRDDRPLADLHPGDQFLHDGERFIATARNIEFNCLRVRDGSLHDLDPQTEVIRLQLAY